MTNVVDKTWRLYGLYMVRFTNKFSSIMIITENDGELCSIYMYLIVKIPLFEIFMKNISCIPVLLKNIVTTNFITWHEIMDVTAWDLICYNDNYRLQIII